MRQEWRNFDMCNLLTVGESGQVRGGFATPMMDFFTRGCPKLKSLTLESLRGWIDPEFTRAEMSKLFSGFPGSEDAMINMDFSNFYDQSIPKKSLEAFYKGCKELKDLKLTRVKFRDLYTEDELKKILPGCNVEIKECQFDRLDEDDSEWTSTDDS